jgi:hypothetical protein
MFWAVAGTVKTYSSVVRVCSTSGCRVVRAAWESAWEPPWNPTGTEDRRTIRTKSAVDCALREAAAAHGLGRRYWPKVVGESGC